MQSCEVKLYKTLTVYQRTLEYAVHEIPYGMSVHIVPLAHVCHPVEDSVEVAVYISDHYALAYWVQFGHPIIATGPYADLVKLATDNGLPVVDAAYRPR